MSIQHLAMPLRAAALALAAAAATAAAADPGPPETPTPESLLARDRAWFEEAQREAGELPPAVRAATIAYGQDRDTSTTQVIYEGTIERYPFGHRQPTLVCAPLRVCVILLEEGETVLDVLVGDSEHWQILEVSMGEGGTVPGLGVRPLVEFGDACDKTTNVAITTDRRFYSILLAIPPCGEDQELDANPQRPYMSQLAFYYPDDILMRWTTKAQLRKKQRAEEASRPKPTRLAPGAGVADLNWSYRLKGTRRFPWRPEAVFDDGERTYIRMPREAREVPSVFEVTGGEDALVNFHTAESDRSLLVISRVAPELVLVLPRGKNTARLHLVNEAREP